MANWALNNIGQLLVRDSTIERLILKVSKIKLKIQYIRDSNMIHKMAKMRLINPIPWQLMRKTKNKPKM